MIQPGNQVGLILSPCPTEAFLGQDIWHPMSIEVIVVFETRIRITPIYLVFGVFYLWDVVVSMSLQRSAKNDGLT